MFEEYLQDAAEFQEVARKYAGAGEEKLAKRSYRASVFCIAGAMEAFVNYIADSFEKGKSIPEHEVSFLNDRALVFSPAKGVYERSEYHRLDDKIRVLLKRFQPAYDFNNKSWVKFMQFKEVRDSLVHPRQFEDDRALEDYNKKVSDALAAVIDIMNVLSQGIFKQPLRKQLLDLIPE